MQADSLVRREVDDLTYQPRKDRRGRPRNGDGYRGRTILHIRSAGPGRPVRARNPLPTPVSRISGWGSGDGAEVDFGSSDARSVLVTPTKMEDGGTVVLLVE